MREIEKDIRTRSRQTCASRFDGVAIADLADPVEVIDASGISWLATLDEWSRNAANHRRCTS